MYSFTMLSCLYTITVILIECVVGNPLSSLTVPNCGRSILPAYYPDRIVGGEFTLLGQHPWMVSLQEQGMFGFEHACGASILNENWIVTAAHCIIYVDQPQQYAIIAGMHKLSEEYTSTARRYKISKIVIHEKFDDDSLFHDIALLKTSTPIDIAGSAGYVNGICLPKDTKDPTGYATVIGWGHTKTDGENSDTMKQVIVPIIDRELCNEAYDKDPDDDIDEVTQDMICAGMTNRDACQNDSGAHCFKQIIMAYQLSLASCLMVLAAAKDSTPESILRFPCIILGWLKSCQNKSFI